MAELISFKVGEASPANTFFAIWMANAAGLYEANGLKLEIVPVVGGRESGPDLSSRRIHLMHIGMSSVIRANAAGADLRTIGSLSNVIRNTMFAAPDIKKPADLKGGTVGISSAGSESEPTTILALRKLGLKREDVMFKEIGVERLSAVRKGAVSATVLGEPYRSQALAEGLTPLVDLFAEKVPWLYSGLVVDRSYLEGNRDTLTRFMKGTIEGNYLAISDEKAAKPVLARELKITDPKIVDLSYANFKSQTPPNAEMSRAGAENIIDIVAAPTMSHKVEDYIDNSILDGLRAEGFFDAMRKKYRMH
jgi:NitT/TauT family transport system substrate-binding protein